MDGGTAGGCQELLVVQESIVTRTGGTAQGCFFIPPSGEEGLLIWDARFFRFPISCLGLTLPTVGRVLFLHQPAPPAPPLRPAPEPPAPRRVPRVRRVHRLHDRRRVRAAHRPPTGVNFRLPRPK